MSKCAIISSTIPNSVNLVELHSVEPNIDVGRQLRKSNKKQVPKIPQENPLKEPASKRNRPTRKTAQPKMSPANAVLNNSQTNDINSAISIESASENGDIPDMKRIKLDDPRIANFNLIKKDCHTLENMRYVGRLDRNDQLVSFGWTKDDVLEKEVRVPVEMNFIQVEFFETMKIMMSIDREITLNWLDSLLLWVNKYEPKNADDLKLYFAPPKDFNLKQLQQIHEWLSSSDAKRINVKYGIDIYGCDIKTLNPLIWLNDKVIDFYMGLIAERSRLDGSNTLPKVHAMNTHFLNQLMVMGYPNIREWTKSVDIFAHDIVLIPVHKGIHWCMAIIHMKNKTIKYFDSLGATNYPVLILSALGEYLKAESVDKKKVELDWTRWTVKNVRNIPQQENGSDCGVFSCMYAEYITRNQSLDFSQEYMPYFRQKMVYEICTGKLFT